MSGPISTSDAYRWLKEELERRSEFGLRTAVVNLVLEPANPFDPTARRKPRFWVLLTAIFLLSGLAVFVYFNVLP